MYYQGQGVAQDYQAAIKWYKLAADQGQAKSQNSLGYMYLQGQGVTLDYIRAYMWLDISASQGIKEAKGNLKKVKWEMNSTDEKKAQELARECEVNDYKGC